jgi:hypothetical protein
VKKIITLILLLAGWSYATNGVDLYNLTQSWLENDINFIDYAEFAASYDGSIVFPVPLPTRYVLTVVSATHGKVTKEPNEPNYIEDNSVVLTAVPDSNYIFGSWNGDLIGNANPATIVMDANKDVNAVFILIAPDINENAIAEPCTPVFEDCYIDLSKGVTNNDANERLQYIITSLPSSGWLIATQPYAQYIQTGMLPYKIPE